MELKNRYVLHIPLSRFQKGSMVRLNIDSILEDLLCDLEGDGLYMTRAEGRYRSRAYDELLITVFSNTQRPGEAFRQWFLKNNDYLGQEAFAYELNNTLVVEGCPKTNMPSPT